MRNSYHTNVRSNRIWERRIWFPNWWSTLSNGWRKKSWEEKSGCASLTVKLNDFTQRLSEYECHTKGELRFYKAERFYPRDVGHVIERQPISAPVAIFLVRVVCCASAISSRLLSMCLILVKLQCMGRIPFVHCQCVCVCVDSSLANTANEFCKALRYA